MQFNWLDYTIMTIILYSILKGMYRGFFNSLGGLAKTLTAVVIAIIYKNPLLCYLDHKHGLVSNLSNIIRQKAALSVTAINIPVKGLQPSLMLTDSADYLAYLIVSLFSFLIILVIVSLVMGIFLKCLDELVARGSLNWLNRFLGIILVTFQNLIILAIIAGIICPLFETAATVGWQWAIAGKSSMQGSYLWTEMVNIFTICQQVLQMNS